MSEAKRPTVEAIAAAMWAEDRASRGLGMELLEVGEGRATLAMRITESMVNGHGIAHGGFIFTLADSAFAFACNWTGSAPWRRTARSPICVPLGSDRG